MRADHARELAFVGAAAVTLVCWRFHRIKGKTSDSETPDGGLFTWVLWLAPSLYGMLRILCDDIPRFVDMWRRDGVAVEVAFANLAGRAVLLGVYGLLFAGGLGLLLGRAWARRDAAPAAKMCIVVQSFVMLIHVAVPFLGRGVAAGEALALVAYLLEDLAILGSATWIFANQRRRRPGATQAV
jgi:hypothetical protein